MYSKSKVEILVTLSVAITLGIGGSAGAEIIVNNNTKWFKVKATREGLVGRVTANGHTIKPNDIFVALPSRKALNKTIEVCNMANNKCLQAKVKDVGPWNSKDDYWNRDGVPLAEKNITKKDILGRNNNKSGIDLGDGVDAAIRCGGSCTVKWRFIDE